MTATNVERSFDLDGTLTDAREGIVACLKYALQGLGHNCPSNLDPARFIGPPLQESFAVLLHSTDPKQINAAVELYRQRFSSKGMLENTVYSGIHSALTHFEGAGRCSLSPPQSPVFLPSA